MEGEFFLKVVGVVFSSILALVTLTSIVFTISANGRARLKDDYNFAKSFLRDRVDNPDMHRLTLERGYFALAGTTKLKVHEIEFLIELESPDNCLRDYVESRKYLKLEKGDHKVGFKGRYRLGLYRKLLIALNFFLYVMFAALAIIPFWFPSFGAPYKYMLLACVSVPFMGFASGDCLMRVVRVVTAQRLVNNQVKHSSMIKHRS